MQKKFFWLALTLFGLVSLAVFTAMPAEASPQPQAFYFTPTPNADGRILYTVKEGDTCISVSLLNNITLDQLRLLNNLDLDCILPTGSQLLLGTAVPEPTPFGPTGTPTPILPSPTPFQGNGRVCILLFDDLNGNAIAGGAVSISDRIGKVSLTGQTSASLEEITCFEELPEGEYNISVAAPEGYNPTTRTNYTLKLVAGDDSTLDFGAQISSLAQPVPVSEGGRSPLLGILGALVVIAGIGMAVYAGLVARK